LFLPLDRGPKNSDPIRYKGWINPFVLENERISRNMSDVSKAQATDLNGAKAGDLEPRPEHSIDNIAAEAGVEMSEGEALHTQATLEQRDQERWELDPDSAQDL
jgi:hypothetical protein